MATFDERAVVISDATTGDKVAVTPAGAVTTDGSAVTQPVSAAALPLPTGAATEATLALIKAKTDNLDVALSTRAVTGLTDAQLRASAVPVSATSLPLPTGAATAALQTQPGVDIGDVTVNNGAGVAAVNIQDGGNSITVDGAVTANIGTTGGLALDATLTNGTQKAIARGGAKGATAAADVTSTNQSADRQAIDVQIRTSTGVPVDTFGAGTQYADGAARGTATGTLAMIDDGTNIQSLSGDSNGRLNVNNISGTVSLPTGAATEATLATRAAAAQLPAALVGGRLDENVGAWLGSTTPTVGQKAMAASLPVTLASDQSAVPISAASLPLPTGAATAANQTTLGSQTTKINDGTNTATVKAASTAPVAADSALVVTVSPNSAPLGSTGAAVPAKAAYTAGADASANLAALQLRTGPPVGTVLGLAVRPVAAQTGTQSSVAGSAANVTLLAANANRLGATLYNDSNQNFFVKLGATASNTSFTVRMPSQSYYEVPFGYTGIIDGIQSVANGNMRVTELT